MPVALIVDDDPSVRQLLRILLQREGMHVKEAANGREALTSLAAEDFDLIVLDLALPYIDGLKLLDRLALNRPVHRNVIVLSAVNLQYLGKINPAAVQAIVRKPFDIHDFVRRAREVVDKETASGSGAFGDALDEALATQGTHMGDVQILDPGAAGLRIVVHRGVGSDFLEHFRIVRRDDGSACARALSEASPVIVEDVRQDEAFTPHRAIASLTGFHSIVSLPLVRRDRSVFGMLSTLFPAARRFSSSEISDLHAYGRRISAMLEPFADQSRSAGH